MYPNPTNNSVNLKFNSSAQTKIEIYVYDITGRLMEKKYLQVNPGQNYSRIDLSGYNSGIYLVSTFENARLIATKKIIKN